MKNFIPFTIALLLYSLEVANAQVVNDTLEIKITVFNYISAWWEGDAVQMENCLHPDLIERSVYQDRESRRNSLSVSTKYTLVEKTRAGGGKNSKEEKGKVDVVIFDIEGKNATAKSWSEKYWEYLHLVKWNWRWVLLNILWGFRNQY